MGAASPQASGYSPELFIFCEGTFFSDLFPRTLPSQRLFYPTPLTRLQVERVTFHFSNDVFGLNLTFESTERIF